MCKATIEKHCWSDGGQPGLQGRVPEAAAGSSIQAPGKGRHRVGGGGGDPWARHRSILLLGAV